VRRDRADGTTKREGAREMEGGKKEEEEVESQVMGSTFRYVTFPFSSSASILQSRPPFPTHPTQPRLHPAFGVSVCW